MKIYHKKATVITRKPYTDYLQSMAFRERIDALADMNKTMELISPSACFFSLSRLDKGFFQNSEYEWKGNTVKQLYSSYLETIKTLGNQMLLSFYYDIISFADSAFLDILYALLGERETELFMQNILIEFRQCAADYQKGHIDSAQQHLVVLSERFHGKIGEYFRNTDLHSGEGSGVSFTWEPSKGRNRYFDMIATDIICKINQGRYQLGEFLPSYEKLSFIYHVSVSTIRRTVSILNKLGILQTINGKGSQVVSNGGPQLLQKFSEFTLDANLISFLESMQVLDAFSGPVIKYTFPYFTGDDLNHICTGARQKDHKKALETVLSNTLQVIVNQCPLNTVKEIYSKITLQMLNGSILRFIKAESRQIPGWRKIADSIIQSCENRNAAQFADSFHDVVQAAFILTKQLLSDSGIAGAGNLE